MPYKLDSELQYSKTCLKRPLKNNTKIGSHDRLSLNAGQRYCRMLQGMHSAIISTFIKEPFVINILVLSTYKAADQSTHRFTIWKTLRYSWFHRPSVLFRISIGTQVTCTYITWLSQPIEICSITTRPSSHVLEASIKKPKEILFCVQTGLYVLHTKWGLVERGHLEPLCMFIVTSKTNSMVMWHRAIKSTVETLYSTFDYYEAVLLCFSKSIPMTFCFI